MSKDGYSRVRACFQNAIDVYSVDDPRNNETLNIEKPIGALPQVPQLPQSAPRTSNPISLREDIFEERVAIMEYDGGVPRPLAEFLASKQYEEV